MPRTITDIIPPSRRRAMEMEPTPSPEVHNDFSNDMPPVEPPKGKFMKKQSKGGFPFGLALIALIVVVVSAGLLFLFASAKVEITPTVNETSVSGDFAATPSTGDLPFEVVSVDKVVSQQVPAEGTENATVAAEGTIVIYNTQSKAQELIKNTRFETPDGHIYRIHDSIVVPAGTATAPGQLSVTAYADATGESYNTGATTFTLPGLKGGPLYEQVYAKADGGMKGGFSGTRPSVSQATRDAQYTKLQATLVKDLEKAVAEKVPEGYVLIPGAIFYTYSPQPDAVDSSSAVSVQYKGSATAFIFPDASLAKALAYRLIGKYDGQPIHLKNVSGLTFTAGGDVAPTPGATSLTFTLTGNTALVWGVNELEIQEAIAGKSRTAAKTILATFPGIEKARIILRPFWKGSFPKDPKGIEVDVKEPKGDR